MSDEQPATPDHDAEVVLRPADPPPVKGLGAWSRRRTWAWAVLAVSGIAAIAAGVAVAIMAVRPADHPDRAAVDGVRPVPLPVASEAGNPGGSQPIPPPAPAVRDDTAHRDELLYLKAMREVDGAFGGIGLLGNPPPVDADRVARVPEQLRLFEPAAGRPDPRGWEWYYLRGLASASRSPAGSQSLVRRLTVGPADLLPGLNTLAWSPDSRQMAAVLTDGQVAILPLAGGEVARRLGLANDRFRTAAWSPDGERFAVGTDGGRLLVWDVDGKELVAVQAHTAGVAVVSWSADGRRLATGTASNEPVKVWEAATGAEVRAFAARANVPIRGLAWSPDGRWLAAAAFPFRVWDTATGAAVHESGSALSVAWSPDSRRLAVSGDARTRVLDAGTWQEALSRSSGGRVAFSPDGKRLAVLGETGLLVLDGASGKELATIRRDKMVGVGGPIEFLSVRWRPDGQQVLVCPLTSLRPMVVDAATGQPLPRDPDLPGQPIGWWVAHPDGRRAVVFVSEPAGGVEVWDVPDRRRLRVITPGRGSRCVAWAADGVLAVGEASGLIRLSDPATGRERTVIRELAESLVDAARTDAQAYRLAGNGALGPPGVPWFGLAALTFSPDGRQLAALTAAGEVWVWAAGDGRQLGRWSAGDPFPGQPTPFYNLAWSPDGRELALRAAKAITVRDARTGQERLALPPDGEVVAWSPDGTRLAAGRGTQPTDRPADRPVTVWDARTGQLVRTLTDPLLTGRIRQYPSEGWPAALAWSPDSRRLAVADASFFTAWITVWDPDTGDYLATARVPRPDVGNASPPLWGPPRAPHKLHPLAWSPDGWKLAAAGLMSNVVATVWDATPPGATGPLIRPAAPPLSPSPPPSPPAAARPESADAVRQAYKAVEVGEWEKADKLLDAVRPAAGELDRRAWEWQFVHALAVRQSAAVRDRRIAVPLGEVKYQRLVWSADGRRLAGLDRDRGVQLIDAATGAVVQSIKGRFVRMALSPDARRLATLGDGAAVMGAGAAVWDTATGKAVAEWPVPAADGGAENGWSRPQPPLSWSVDGTRLALPGAEPGTVRVWDAGTGTAAVLHGGPAAVTALAWSPDGRQLAGGCQDGAVRRWEVATGQSLPPLGALGRRVWAVAWSPDGKRLVAAAGMAPDLLSTLRAYDLATGSPAWEATRFGVDLVDARSSPPCSDDPGLVWTPDGSHLLLRGDPAGVTDAATGRPVHTVLDEHRAGHPTFSPDGRRLALVPFRTPQFAAPAVRVLEAATSREVVRLGVDGVRGRATALTWSPDGSRLAIAAGPPHAALEVWDATGGTPPVARRLSDVAEFDWHPDGRRLIAISRHTRTPAVVPVADLPPVTAAPPPPADRGRTLVLSPDGKRVAAVVGEDRLSVWEAAATRPAWEVVVPHQWPSTDPLVYAGQVTLDWSPSGRRLAALGADRTIRVWDAADGREVTRLGVGYASSNTNSLSVLALSPDDRRLAYFAHHHDRTVVFVHDLPSGGSVRAIMMDKNRDCTALAWSPDGRHLAVVVDELATLEEGYHRVLAEVHDPTTGALVTQPPFDLRDRRKSLTTVALVTQLPFDLRDRRKSLTTVSWSPDGKRLCVGTAVREVATGARVPLAAGPTDAGVKAAREADPVDLVAVPAVWRPDGTQLALLGRKDVRVFDAADGSQVSATPIPAVAAVSPRPLTWTGAAPRYWTAPADPAVPPPLRTDPGPPPSAPRPEQRPQFPHTRAATVSPDGKHLAVVSHDDQLTVTDVATGKVVWDDQSLRWRLAEPTDPIGGRERYHVRWSVRQDPTVYWAPDGRRLAAWTPQGLWLLDVAAGRKGNRRVPLPDRPPFMESDRAGFAWSPDGRRLAGVFCKHGSVMVSVLDTTSLRETFTHAAAGPPRHPGPGHLGPPPTPGVAWHPDGNRLAVSLEAVEVWDTAARRRLIALPAGGNRSLAWTPDGKRLLARGPAGVGGGFDTTEELTVWDGESDTPLLTVRGPATAARPSPDGRTLATGPTDDHAVVVTEIDGP